MTSVQVYRMGDFVKVMLDGFTNTLHPSIIDIIQKLSKNVGAPDYVKTPKFEARIQKKTDDLPDPWIPIAKPPKSNKSKIEETVDIIKINLNKLTEKSFDAQTDCIIKSITSIRSVSKFDDIDNTMTMLGELIYEISSSNLFYSKIYAKLFNELVIKFPFMVGILQNSIAKSTKDLFGTFDYVNLDTDYDKFCDFNKSNEKRKSTVLFYIHLVKLRVISITPIINMLVVIQTRMSELINSKDNVRLIDEMSEISFILITNLYNYIKTNNHTINDNVLIDPQKCPSIKVHEQSNSIIDDCVAYITDISNTNNKVVMGLSNKSKFKHMDMLANIAVKQ